MMQHLDPVERSPCALLYCPYDVEDILLCIAGGKSDGGAVICVKDTDD